MIEVLSDQAYAAFVSECRELVRHTLTRVDGGVDVFALDAEIPAFSSLGARCRSVRYPLDQAVEAIHHAVVDVVAAAEQGASANDRVAVERIARRSLAGHRCTVAFVSGWAASSTPGWWSASTPVARSTLRLVAEGWTSREIAERLRYSESTIAYHVSELMKRLGARNRTALVHRAWEEGLLDRQPSLEGAADPETVG